LLRWARLLWLSRRACGMVLRGTCDVLHPRASSDICGVAQTSSLSLLSLLIGDLVNSCYLSRLSKCIVSRQIVSTSAVTCPRCYGGFRGSCSRNAFCLLVSHSTYRSSDLCCGVAEGGPRLPIERGITRLREIGNREGPRHAPQRSAQLIHSSSGLCLTASLHVH